VRFFYSRQRHSTTFPYSSVSFSALYRARRTTNEGIGGRSEVLEWMEEEYVEESKANSGTKRKRSVERRRRRDRGEGEGEGGQRSEDRS